MRVALPGSHGKRRVRWIERRHGVARICPRMVDGSGEAGDRGSGGRGIDIGILRRKRRERKDSRWQTRDEKDKLF